MSVGPLEFSGGKAEIAEVSKCLGDVSFFLKFFFMISKVKFCIKIHQGVPFV